MKTEELTQGPDPTVDPITAAAQKAFGIKYLYPWQRLVIANILDDLTDDSSPGAPLATSISPGAPLASSPGAPSAASSTPGAPSAASPTAATSPGAPLATSSAPATSSGAPHATSSSSGAAHASSSGAPSAASSVPATSSAPATSSGAPLASSPGAPSAASSTPGAPSAASPTAATSPGAPLATSSSSAPATSPGAPLATGSGAPHASSPAPAAGAAHAASPAHSAGAPLTTSSSPGAPLATGNRCIQQIVLLPTGAGKSMCFLVPALLFPGPTLILYPLLALMSDQARRMREGGMTPVVFRGQQTEAEREENFRLIREGAKVILANPEVLQSAELVTRLAGCGISHIALDEAHCVSEWGDTFRPAYLTLGSIIQKLGVPRVTAFTATASPTVLSRMNQVLFQGQGHIVRSEADRPNIHYYVHYACAKEKAVLQLVEQEEKPLIVFCGTRRRVEMMAHMISEQQARLHPELTDTVRFYHAGLSREEKDAAEHWFHPAKDAILVCTCAFGMGVDKKDIRAVIHLDAPATAEAFIQEAGRGGRDGSVAKSFLVWSPGDSAKAKDAAPGSRQRVLADFAESRNCRRQVLLDALGGEKVACRGCDICLGCAEKKPEDAESVIRFIRHHTRQYTLQEAAAELAETACYGGKERHGKEGIKKTPLDRGDYLTIIGDLIADGQLKKHRWPWKDRLSASPYRGL